MPDSLTTLTRRVLFAPLDEPGRTETVVTRIRSAITLGIYAQDEQLPNEITLATQFNISPVTLSDALKVLRDEGLVRTTRGRIGGTFVIAPDESNMKFFENSLAALSPIELRDLLDWQTAITSRAAMLAAERASAHDFSALTQTVSSLGAAHDPITARRAHSRFLIELAASSRSSRISKAAISLQIEFAPHVTLAFRDPDARKTAFELSTGIIESVARHKPNAAQMGVISLIAFLGGEIQESHHELTHKPQQNLPETVGQQ